MYTGRGRRDEGGRWTRPNVDVCANGGVHESPGGTDSANAGDIAPGDVEAKASAGTSGQGRGLANERFSRRGLADDHLDGAGRQDGELHVRGVRHTRDDEVTIAGHLGGG